MRALGAPRTLGVPGVCRARCERSARWACRARACRVHAPGAVLVRGRPGRLRLGGSGLAITTLRRSSRRAAATPATAAAAAESYQSGELKETIERDMME